MSNDLKIGGAVAGRLLIYRVGKKPILEYLAPLRVNLGKGVALLIDRKSVFPTKPVYCDAPGCIGFTDLSGRLLTGMKNGGKIEMVFTLVNDGKQFAFPFTLDGFTKVYAEYESKAKK